MKIYQTNITFNKNLKVIDKDGEEKEYILSATYKPNLVGQHKKNYLTPPHNIDLKPSFIKEFLANTVEKANKFKNNAEIFIINCKDEKILFSKNGEMIEEKNAPSVEEYSK